MRKMQILAVSLPIFNSQTVEHKYNIKNSDDGSKHSKSSGLFIVRNSE
jgi:hypothetical protein